MIGVRKLPQVILSTCILDQLGSVRKGSVLRSSQKMEFIKISSKLLTYRLKAFNIISAISSKYLSPAQTFPLNSRITCPVAYLTSSLGYLTKFSNSTSKTKLFTFKSCSLKNLSISVNINCILLIAQSKTLEF